MGAQVDWICVAVKQRNKRGDGTCCSVRIPCTGRPSATRVYCHFTLCNIASSGVVESGRHNDESPDYRVACCLRSALSTTPEKEIVMASGQWGRSRVQMSVMIHLGHYLLSHRQFSRSCCFDGFVIIDDCGREAHAGVDCIAPFQTRRYVG